MAAYAPPQILTQLIAEFQLAMANPRFTEEEKNEFALRFNEMTADMGQPRWATNPGPQAAAYVSLADELFFGGSTGPGKLQSLTSKILTPKGWREFGSLKVGDFVSDPVTGGHSTVIKISPTGKVPVYRVICDDGASTEAGAEHLWAYKRPRHVRPGTKTSAQREFVRAELGRAADPGRWGNHRIGTTADLQRLVDCDEHPRIPLTEPVLFTVNGRTGTGLHDPYTLGVMLGDGHLPTLTVTACDDGIRDHLLASGFRAAKELHHDGKPKTYRAVAEHGFAIKQWLRKYGLHQSRSWEKFIPDYVFTASVQYRLEFLRGLMDTDGYADTSGDCFFTSVSERLATGVRDLVRSLGGKTHWRIKHPTYTHKGEKLNGRVAYEQQIYIHNAPAIFRLQRKKDRCHIGWNGGHDNMRSIVQIEPVGEKETQCIQVSSPFGLYITDDFIVTHNSALLLGLGLTAHWRTLILRLEGTNLTELKDQLIAQKIPGDHSKHIGNGMQFTTVDGRRIELLGCDDEKRASGLQGRPHDLLEFDELPQFNELLFRRLASWLRTTVPGQRTRVVGAGNPPLQAEEEWVLRYWGPWLDDQNPSYPASPGELRYFTTIDGKEEEVADGSPITVHYKGKPDIIVPKSRTFIPATLEDNPDLNTPEYRARLAALPEPLRTQFLYGDMSIGRLDHEWQVLPTEWVTNSMRKRWRPDGKGDRRMDAAALDCAMNGKDNLVLAKRYANWIAPLNTWPGKEIKEGRDAVGRVLLKLESLHMPLVIDVGATPGGSIVQAFKEQFRELRTGALSVWAVNFGEKSQYKDRSGRLEMANIRAEAFWRLREWLDPAGGPPETRLQLPDDPLLAAELCNVRWKPVGGRVQLEDKKEIAKRLGRSPDRADAVAMTALTEGRSGGWIVPQEAPASPILRPPGYEISRIGGLQVGGFGRDERGMSGFMGMGK